jgi:uncharacterized protein YlxW (UPF0749 family)
MRPALAFWFLVVVAVVAEERRELMVRSDDTRLLTTQLQSLQATVNHLAADVARLKTKGKITINKATILFYVHLPL